MSEPNDRTETLEDPSEPTWPGAEERLRAAGTPLFEEDRPPAPADAPPPRVLSGRYLLEERIASGGMASVWRGVDQVLARVVAVKLLHDHLAADEDFRERFRREAISAAKLSHPNIVGLYDTGTDGEQVFLVMEFIDGATLRDVVATSGALPVGTAVRISERVARALDYAHQRGLVHRDVKPANILIGNDGLVKVADFGIAKADQAGDLTKTGMVLGTAAYVAPEQILAAPINGQADQYALGCVLYEALTGRQPFRADTAVATAAQRLERNPPPLADQRADVPAELAQIVARMMARDPASRFPSAGVLADALAPYATADETPASLMAAHVEERSPTRVDLQPPSQGGIAETVVRPAPPRDPTPRDPTPRDPTPRDPAPAAREPTQTAGPPRRKRRGRVLIPFLLLLALAVVGGGLVAVDRGVFEVPAEPSPPASASPSPSPTALALTAADLTDFDPQGSGAPGENPADLPNLIDGDPTTTWTTEGYESPTLRGVKDGVGFVVDLGRSTVVDAVQLTVALPGVAVELRGADEELDATDPEAASDTELLDSTAAAEAVTELGPDEPTEARYLLIWVTGNLQPDSGRNRASFSELVVRGTPA